MDPENSKVMLKVELFFEENVLSVFLEVLVYDTVKNDVSSKKCDLLKCWSIGK